MEENDALQRQMQAHEDDFKLQNQTLMQEVNRLSDENEWLQKEVSRVSDGGDSTVVNTDNDADLMRLKAENSALQKSIKSTEERYEKELEAMHIKYETLSAQHSTLESRCITLVSGHRGIPAGGPLDDERMVEGEAVAMETETNQSEGSSDKEKGLVMKLKAVLDKEFESFFENIIKFKSESSGVDGDADKKAVEENSTEEQNKDVDRDTDKKVVDENSTEEQNKDVDGDTDENLVDENSTEEQNKEDSHTEDVEFHELCNKEGIKLKESLCESLLPLLSSLPLKAEDRNKELEKQLREMTSLQLKLDTEHEEKCLLQEQLKSLKDASHKEIADLKEKLNKWMDKAKKKQESFLQLQEEKETLYTDSKTSLEELRSSKDEEIKVLQTQSANLQIEVNAVNERYIEIQEQYKRQVQDLQEAINSLQSKASVSAAENSQLIEAYRHENATLKTDNANMKETFQGHQKEVDEKKKIISQLEEQVKHLENISSTKVQETEGLKEQLKEFLDTNDGMLEQVHQLEQERDQAVQTQADSVKLAEKRKTMLDELAIERQSAEKEHRESVEKLNKQHVDELTSIQEANEKIIEDLNSQLSVEKKLKKELDESQKEFAELKKQFLSIESKAGWFERRLQETEDSLKQEKDENIKHIEELKEENQKELHMLRDEHQHELEELQAEIHELKDEKEKHETELEKLGQEIKDKEVENKIAGKKGDHLVKDLKRQLKLERKKSEQLQQRLQEVLSETRAQQGFDEIFNPDLRRRNSGDSSILSGRDTETSDIKPPSPLSSSIDALSEETTDLIERLAQLQQQNWQLEERVRHLEENAASLAEDVMNKAAIIQTYVMDRKGDYVPDSPRQLSKLSLKNRVKDTFTIGKSEDFLKEMSRKMQRMLEETMTKNIQLQKDMELLSQEVQTYRDKERSSTMTNEDSTSERSRLDSLDLELESREKTGSVISNHSALTQSDIQTEQSQDTQPLDELELDESQEHQGREGEEIVAASNRT